MRTIGFAALALLIISAGFGIWIALAGSPYGTALLTLHKLTSIAFGVLCVLFFIRSVQSGGMTGGDIAVAAVFAVSVLALLATGGIMSAKQPTLLLRAIHIAGSAAAYITAGIRLVRFLIA